MDTESVTFGGAAFRPTKRRKFTRTRRVSESDASEPGKDHPTPPENNGDVIDPPISDALRLRRNRLRKPGIEFSTTRPQSSEPPPPSTESAISDPQAESMKAISDRFVAHSGQVIDVDKHMVAYIESEMAKRRLGPSIPESSTTTSHTQTPNDEDAASLNKPATPPQRQPAALGKIHEIDLGRDASLLNQQRTEIAIRRARGEQIPVEEPAVVKKPRLGRNGKPRRGPKRRNSEDLKRDQLVEQVLHESRLEIYDEPEAEQHQQEGDDNGLDTDERIAEQFRQDFIDAMQARQRNRTSGQPKAPTAKGGEQLSRGPKLGGSRSARAAMRELQEKAAAKK